MSTAIHTSFTIYPRLTQPGYAMHTASSRAKHQSHIHRRPRRSDTASSSASTSTPTQTLHPALDTTPTATTHRHSLTMTNGHPVAYPSYQPAASSSAAPGTATQRRRSRELAEMRQWSAQQAAIAGGRAAPAAAASTSSSTAATRPGSSSASAQASSGKSKRPTDPFYGHQSASMMASSFVSGSPVSLIDLG